MEQFTKRKVKISLGKVDGYRNGRRSCEAEVEMRLKELKPGKFEFTACGKVWNVKKTDILMGGQCIEQIADMVSEEYKDVVDFVKEMWDRYHFLHAGTPAQEALLKQAVRNGELSSYGVSNYEETLAYLEKHGLLYDKDYEEETEEGYKYGTGWLYEPIPEYDLKAIEEFMGSGIVPSWWNKEECCLVPSWWNKEECCLETEEGVLELE